MIFDTHSHLNFPAFKNDWEEIIQKCLKEQIGIINIGSNFQTSKRAIEIAEKFFDFPIYATVGLHPLNLDTGLVKMKTDTFEGSFFEKEFDFENYKKLASFKKVVAIGEIGLDFYWRPKTTTKKKLFKQKQKDLLLKQLIIAKELNLPVIFHCRMAHRDLINFLRENENLKPQKAVAHGFVGSLEELKEYLDFGFYIGFNGIIFKKIEGINFEKNIKNTPLERILIETDCPYLTPPQEKEKRNNPLFIQYVAEKIAEIKNLSLEKITEKTTQNARTLFGLNTSIKI